MTVPVTIDVIPFVQPIGDFLLGVMRVPDLIDISKADPRKFDHISMETVGGIQRDPSPTRIKAIAEYSKTVDAGFPTPILLALEKNDYTYENNKLIVLKYVCADIVDGQHRVLGLKEAKIKDEFMIPVVFLLDATEEQKALIFATINGKQTKVPASLIYELFEVTKARSPQKTAHEIARALNSDENSPWYQKLKMLGKKTPGFEETLSQGTFVKWLLPLISKKADIVRNLLKNGDPVPPEPDCIFNDYWRNDRDSTILKILLNVFNAAKRTWPEQWQNPTQYTLTKTNGFTGIMKALPKMFEEGKKKKELTEDYFAGIFTKVKNKMEADKIEFTIKYFEPSAAGEARFRNLIEDNI